MAPEPVTASVWLEQRLQRALARIDALAGEVGQLREALRSEQAETARLQEELALLNGRTVRHDATLDQLRALQQRTAALEERLEAEAGLRRDLAGAEDRGHLRNSEAQQALEQSLARLDAGLTRTVERLNALELRQRQAAAESGITPEDTALTVRLETLERFIETVAANVHRESEARAAAASAIPDLRLAIDALEARARTLHEEQQRLEDELAHAGTPEGLQAAVEDAIEQARSLRERVELRLGALEAESEETREAHDATALERALLQRRLAAQDEELRVLARRVEAQRDTLIEHVRRATAAAEDAGRRQMQEIDRQTRAGRELLTRLIEHSDEGAQEQPL